MSKGILYIHTSQMYRVQMNTGRRKFVGQKIMPLLGKFSEKKGHLSCS